jgi:hypothetical protein
MTICYWEIMVETSISVNISMKMCMKVAWYHET